MKDTKKEISREVGLEVTSIFGKYFIQLDHLHYGYWPDNLKVNAANLHIAQEEYVKFITSHIPAGVKTILDVGCGTGQIAKTLLDMGYKVDCVSPSPFLKKSASELLGDKSRIFECFYEDLQTDERYDMIMFCESFQYIKLEKALSKTDSLLNNGGHLFICDFFRIDVQSKPFMGGGHKLPKFYNLVSASAFKLIEKVDITKETAPNMDLLKDVLENVIAPSIDAGLRFVNSRFPIILKFIKWKYREKIQKFENKYLTGNITGENFKRDKRYLFLLYKKDILPEKSL